jgi:hypothetical protein
VPPAVHSFISPSFGFIEVVEYQRANRLAGPNARFQVPAPLELRVVGLAVETRQDSHELTVMKDEAAIGVVAVDQNGDTWLPPLLGEARASLSRLRPDKPCKR